MPPIQCSNDPDNTYPGPEAEPNSLRNLEFNPPTPLHLLHRTPERSTLNWISSGDSSPCCSLCRCVLCNIGLERADKTLQVCRPPTSGANVSLSCSSSVAATFASSAKATKICQSNPSVQCWILLIMSYIPKIMLFPPSHLRKAYVYAFFLPCHI